MWSTHPSQQHSRWSCSWYFLVYWSLDLQRSVYLQSVYLTHSSLFWKKTSSSFRQSRPWYCWHSPRYFLYLLRLVCFGLHYSCAPHNIHNSFRGILGPRNLALCSLDNSSKDSSSGNNIKLGRSLTGHNSNSSDNGCKQQQCVPSFLRFWSSHTHPIRDQLSAHDRDKGTDNKKNSKTFC